MTRVTTSIAASLLVMMTAVVPVRFSPAPAEVTLSADSTALLMCGTTCPKWDDAGVEAVMDKFVTPTHPGQTITPVAVTAPGESWPFTGLFRVLGLLLGDPSIFGPGGPAWPEQPWWKLSGLFDLTGDQSTEAGAASLQAAMAAHPDDSLVIYGVSQGAASANVVKRRLADQYSDVDTAPDIDFVLQGDLNMPNGGLQSRFPGLYVPILDWTFNGPAPTDTAFDTVVISTQYDGFADFPLYPINLIADVNALLGILYLHTRPFDVSLPPDPETSPAYRGTHGDSSYYFFETQDLPLFAPLRMLGVPEPLIDVIEPFFRVIVELGYDRSIPLWEPTPARLFPRLDPSAVFTDLGNAIGEGIDNALALVGVPPIPRTQAPVTGETPPAEVVETEVLQADMSIEGSSAAVPETEDAGPVDAAEDVELSSVDTTESAEQEEESMDDHTSTSGLVEQDSVDATEPPTTSEGSSSTPSSSTPSSSDESLPEDGNPPSSESSGSDDGEST